MIEEFSLSNYFENFFGKQKEEGVWIKPTILFRRTKSNLSHNLKIMKIFRAIGLGLGLIIIRFLMPEVFMALETALLKFFEFFGTVFSFGSETFEAGLYPNVITPAAINLVP